MVILPKKGSIYLVRTNTIEKHIKKEGGTTMEIEQKTVTQKAMNK